MRTIYCCPYCRASHLYYDAWVDYIHNVKGEN